MRILSKIGVLMALLSVHPLFALNLQEAMLHILQTNPLIQERLKNYNATREDVTIAKSGWLPKLDYYGGVGREWGKNLYTDHDWNDYRIYENSLLLTQNIFNGWSTTHQINTQQARVLAAAYNYIEVVDDTGYRLVNYYLEVVKNRELLKIAEENIRINEEIFNKVNKLYQGGLTTKSEMEKAAASLALARSNEVVQRNNLSDALFQFKYFYGEKVDPEAFEIPDLALSLPGSYEEGRNYALNHNPSILVQRYNIKVAQEDYEEKRGRYYPSVDIRARSSWNYNMGGERDGHDDRYRVTATLSYNLFNGFADKAAIQKGVSKVQQEVMLKHDLMRKTEESFDLSWAAYEHLKNKLEHLQEYKLHAVNTLRLYSKEYEMGRRSLLDLLSAQNDLINAKSQIVMTKYGYLFSKYRILDAMGTMVPAVVGRSGIYTARVGLGPDDESKQDSLPVDILNENNTFLETLQKSVTKKEK
ncbi:TolC family outer membrane protein [Hydrogenimonas urashimensis]|uniref:TolC family outer membrane protein n=1 Tax=Hydrogenimonas urashimensis TaxID=2740515 RepID=UPI001916B2FB|nr:TolC family outer membrane protein [Hydrogenimonas urashimensis]